MRMTVVFFAKCFSDCSRDYVCYVGNGLCPVFG